MDAKDIINISDDIAQKLPKALLDHPGIEKVIFAIGKIASYLESEQGKRIALNKRMDMHQQLMESHLDVITKTIWGDKSDLTAKPGLAYEVERSRKQSEKNGKLLWTVLSAVIVAMTLAILQILGFKLK